MTNAERIAKAYLANIWIRDNARLGSKSYYKAEATAERCFARLEKLVGTDRAVELCS